MCSSRSTVPTVPTVSTVSTVLIQFAFLCLASEGSALRLRNFVIYLPYIPGSAAYSLTRQLDYPALRPLLKAILQSASTAGGQASDLRRSVRIRSDSFGGLLDRQSVNCAFCRLSIQNGQLCRNSIDWCLSVSLSTLNPALSSLKTVSARLRSDSSLFRVLDASQSLKKQLRIAASAG